LFKKRGGASLGIINNKFPFPRREKKGDFKKGKEGKKWS